LPVIVEHLHYDKEGNPRNIEIHATPVFDGEGNVNEIIEYFLDITERKQAEKEKESLARFPSENPNPVLRVAKDGTILYANAAALPLLRTWGCQENHSLPDEWRKFSSDVFSSGSSKNSEVEYEDNVFSLTFAPIVNAEYLNIYGLDITERQRVEEELQISQEQLRNLSSYLQSAREQERTSIAREIHDDLGQTITALKMDLSWFGKRLPKDHEPLREKKKSMDKTLNEALESIERIITELRPGVLDDLGLIAAIEWQGGDFQDRTGIRCKFNIDPEEIVLDKERSTAIFRIFQETLINITRHANATRVNISLTEEEDKLVLKVKDDGKGIREEQISDFKSFGLMGIRERAYLFGGKVKIKGVKGKGTTVTVSIPVEKE